MKQAVVSFAKKTLSDKWLGRFHKTVGIILHPKRDLINAWPDSLANARILFSLRALYNFRDFHIRKKLANSLVKTPREISDDMGFAVFNFQDNPAFRNAVEHCQKLAKGLDFEEMEKKSKKKFLISVDLDLDSDESAAIRSLVLDPEFLSPIANYLGHVPILITASLWYSPNKVLEEGRSQQYHIDATDVKQVKCFIPLDDISEDNGPLHVISAAKSETLYHRLREVDQNHKRNQKRHDDIIFAYVDKKDEQKMTAKVGNVAMVDTSRCYHFGSRPAPKPRLLLRIQFHSPYARTIPLFSKRNKKYRDLPTQDLQKNIFAYYQPR